MRVRALIVAAFALTACQRAETPEQTAARIQTESDSARVAFEAILTTFSQHFNAGQIDSVVAIYGDQAHVMPPNARPVHGRDAIRQMFRAYFQNGPVGQLRLHLENVTANGPVAVVRAGWTFAPLAGAPLPADTGVSIGHWQKVDGRWQLMEDIWRSDLPAPPPPPRRH